MKKLKLTIIALLLLITNAGAACSVTINPAGTVQLCQGEQVTFTASATGTSPYVYLWSTGETSSAITADASGTYSVAITDAINCTTVSTPVNVTVNPLPPVCITPDTTICLGEAIELTACCGLSSSWSPGDYLACTACCNTFGAPFFTTTYVFTVADSNGCTNSASTTITIDSYPCQWLVDKVKNNPGIALITNPFSKTSTLVCSEFYFNSKMDVYDALGKKVTSIPVENERTTVRRNTMTSGMYFYLILKNEELIYSGKMILN